MHQGLRTLTREIRQAARDLRRHYEPARLYELRVAIRRIRSVLQHRSSKRARRFRRTWGGFAAATNPARDWDVFLANAGELLSPAKLEDFQRVGDAHVQASREAVVRMLESACWRYHLKEWKRFLARAREHHKAHAGEFAAPARAAALDAAVVRARIALITALQQDDDYSWHKFRIAAKEVRYTAEREPPAPGHESLAAELVETCKALQSLLGGWHDSVIQLQLIDKLPPSPLAVELREAIALRRRQRLADIRAVVTAHSLLKLCDSRTGGSGTRQTRARENLSPEVPGHP
jgi:CHAD domain-containing protein